MAKIKRASITKGQVDAIAEAKDTLANSADALRVERTELKLALHFTPSKAKTITGWLQATDNTEQET